MGTLIAGIFFGILGSGYILYGRKAQHPVALVAGVLLCVYPYVVDGVWWTLAVGTALAAAPWVVAW